MNIKEAVFDYLSVDSPTAPRPKPRWHAVADMALSALEFPVRFGVAMWPSVAMSALIIGGLIYVGDSIR